MTIKEAIGKFRAPQLTCRYHRMCMLGAPRHLIAACRALAKNFAGNNFQIICTGFTADGSEKHNWKIDTNQNREDIDTANKIVVKTEGAMGYDCYEQPVAILKMTTEDNGVYYYDGEDKLTTRKWELSDVTLQENFSPIEL